MRLLTGIGLPGQPPLGSLALAQTDRGMQIDAGASLFQKLSDCLVPSPGGLIQGRFLPLVDYLQSGAPIDQNLDDRQISLGSRVM